MKVSTLVVTFAFLVLLGSIIFAASKPHEATALSSAPPAGRTGAPGDAGTCATCHSGTGGAGALIMALYDFNPTYVPGQTDTLVIGIGAPGATRWGFEVTALKNSDNTMAGTFGTIPDLAIQTGTEASGGRIYMGHRSNGAIAPFDLNDGTEWGFATGGWLVEWTPPAQGTGDVTFYAAGIAADGSQSAGATDTTYTATYVVTEQAPSPVTSTTWGKIKTRFR